MRRLGFWALVALAVWWAVQDPTAAAGLVHQVGGFLTHAAQSLTTLTSSL